ncbi:MAG: FAD-binding oxidoreductase [Aliivibrio sp.]|uniref:NAD(P)/FAD-dependent oxidoreductase n=1 Tax=Aliivibrio sp. TaxID=1872443 RepID=UPI001A3F54BA|nr:FAD-binding oxidoreductase [Aliivibrio sp.]
MNRDAKIDVIIIGGGIVGLCCAYRLQKSGLKTRLIDSKGVAQGCSKGNAGHFATEQIFPLSSPALLPQLPKMLFDPQSPVSIRWRDILQTLPWMCRFLFNARPKQFSKATSALIELNKHSLESWQQLLTEIGKLHMLKDEGSLLVFETDKAFNRYLSMLDELLLNGVDAIVLDGNEARRKEPNLSHNVKYAILFPSTGHTVEPYDLCISISEAYQGIGGEVVIDKVEAISLSESDCQVETSRLGKMRTEKVLLSAGVWSAKLAKQLTNINAPLQAERGYHLMIPKSANTLSMAVSSAERKFIMTPMSGGLRLAGTVEYAHVDAVENPHRSTMLHQHARALIPNLSQQTGDGWMGPRPSLPDSLPVIDLACDDRVLMAFGHQHLGLTQAAFTADLILSLHQQQPTKIEIKPYSISRFI